MSMFLYWMPIIELLVLMVIEHVLYGTGYSIIKVFNSVWLINHLVYALKLLDYYPLRDSVLFYSMLFIFVTNITFIALKKGTCIRFKRNTNLFYDFLFIEKRINVICIISVGIWFFSFPRLQKSVSLIMQYGMIAMRNFAYDEVTFTTIEKLIYSYFIQPIITISIILSAASMVSIHFDKKSRLKITLVSIINAIVYSLLFAGRGILVQIVVYMVFAIVIKSGFSVKKLFKEQKKVLLFLVIIIVPILIYSSQRVTRSWGLIKEVGLYLTGGLGFLSEAGSSGYGSLLGRCSIGCLYDTFGLFLKILGLNVKLVSQYYSDYASEMLLIGYSIRSNFTATCMGSFLLDFNWFGLIIGGCIYGFVFSFVGNQFSRTKMIYQFMMLMYFTNVAVESIQNYTFKGVGFLFTMIYLILFFRIDIENDKGWVI